MSEVLAEAAEAGVRRCVTVGTDVEDSKSAISLARRFENVWATAGIHPHEAGKTCATTWPQLAELLRSGSVVAVGETGLDYHYDFSDRESQREAFVRQIALAHEVDLPLIIHCRQAVDDALAILGQSCRGPARGVFHCFTGTREEAFRILDANCSIREIP